MKTEVIKTEIEVPIVNGFVFKRIGYPVRGEYYFRIYSRDQTFPTLAHLDHSEEQAFIYEPQELLSFGAALDKAVKEFKYCRRVDWEDKYIWYDGNNHHFNLTSKINGKNENKVMYELPKEYWTYDNWIVLNTPL